MDTSPGLSPPENAPEASPRTTASYEAPSASSVPRTGPPRTHDETVEAALAASTRAEATLGALYAAIQQVTQGVSGAREANEQLSSELHRVREMLATANEQHLVYENQVALLQQQLEAAQSDREFLIEEQDRFLAGLLEEHAQTVEQLIAEREEAFQRVERLMRQVQETAPPMPRARVSTHPGLGEDSAVTPPLRSIERPDVDRNVEKLLAERDRSREVLRRLQAQRDEAHQALAAVTKERDRYLSELSRIAPGRVAAPRPLVSVEDSRRTQPAVPHLTTRTTDPSPADDGALGQPIGERMTLPPAIDQSAVIALSRPSPPSGTLAQPASADEKPPIKRKPDPTTQPLGGYSLRGDDTKEPKGTR